MRCKNNNKNSTANFGSSRNHHESEGQKIDRLQNTRDYYRYDKYNQAKNDNQRRRADRKADHYESELRKTDGNWGSKPSLLNRVRDKFKQKDATVDEINQLKLNTVREELKTRKQKAIKARPSRFGFFEGGGSPSRGGGRRRSVPDPLFGGGNSNFFGGQDSSPSLSFITGVEPKGRRKQDSGLGQGLTDLF